VTRVTVRNRLKEGVHPTDLRSREISGDFWGLTGGEGVAEIAGIAVIARDRRDRKAEKTFCRRCMRERR
jgi:hypothetical protein